MYLFSSILGVFVFDDKCSIVDKVLYASSGDYKNKEKYMLEMQERHRNAQVPDRKALAKILLHFKDNGYFKDFYAKNLELTKLDLKNSVGTDTLIIQAINSIEDIDKVINVLSKRLREWYELHNPEYSMATRNSENFVVEISEKGKKELLGPLKIKVEDSFGADLAQEDLEPIKSLAHQLYGLHQLKKNLIEYISTSMDDFCPNLKAVCDPILAAKLIEHSGSLKRLSQMPSSTIQILGAEQALFRHLKTGSKPPRHGVIVGHELFAKALNNMHGKIARAIADKVSIASKIDYFNGKYIGDSLRKELWAKFEWIQ